MLRHEAGGATYESLHDRLPPDQRSFADVWTTLAASDGVYFVTSGHLFRWSEVRGIESWSSDAPMKYAARLRHTVFVHQNGRGLAAVRKGRLQRVPGTEPLTDVTVHFMTSAEPDRLLLGTRTDGLFVFDGERLTRLPTAVDAQLDALQLDDGLVLPDGSIALATEPPSGSFRRLTRHLAPGLTARRERCGCVATSTNRSRISKTTSPREAAAGPHTFLWFINGDDELSAYALGWSVNTYTATRYRY